MRRRFTLVMLLIVVTVIGILVAMAIPAIDLLALMKETAIIASLEAPPTQAAQLVLVFDSGAAIAGTTLGADRGWRRAVDKSLTEPTRASGVYWRCRHPGASAMRFASPPLLAAGALAAITPLAWGQQGTPPDPEPLAVGTVAPDFALPAATRYGLLAQPIHLSDFRGKTVVLAFFFKARSKG